MQSQSGADGVASRWKDTGTHPPISPSVPNQQEEKWPDKKLHLAMDKLLSKYGYHQHAA